MEKGAAKGKGSQAKSSKHHTPEKELSFVVLQAAEMNDVRYLKDYMQMTKLSSELNVNEFDSKGCTSLHFAVASRKLDVVKILVEYGANVNQRDFMGFTALFWATGRYPNVEIAKYLIEVGRASVHLTNNSGACALHGAALQGNSECVALLLKHGADSRCADHNGSTPLDLAEGEETKAELYKAIAHADLQADNTGGSCSQCGSEKEVELKRCGKCFMVRYCGRDCQVAHWKAGHRTDCPGSLTAYCKSEQGLYCVLNHQKLTVHTNAGAGVKSEPPVKKKFVVKVQVPIDDDYKSLEGHEMMVYNEDRSLTAFIPSTEKGYSMLKENIAKNGWRGIKAFFWAELNAEKENETFKVFHGKCAPYQSW